MKRIISNLLILILCLVLFAPQTAEAAVKISKAKATLEVDATLTLKITGTEEKSTWSSSDKTVATVSKGGKITAKKEGRATITATVGNAKYTCEVTVVDSNKEIEINTFEELQDYLNEKYSVIDTEMGKVTLKHTVVERFSNTIPYDARISTDWEGISPFDIEYSNSYTSKQKETTKEALREVQENIYKDAIKFFPYTKFEGGYIKNWYEYPTLRVGYRSIKFLSWSNINYSGDVYTYKTSTVNEFKWTPLYDDYDFTK